jgi:IMP dehydrogenase/GMP reductase
MKAFTFSDVAIIPAFSSIPHRSDEFIDISTTLGSYKFELPIISANMPAITNYKMALALRSKGAMSILHRHNTIEEEQYEFTKSLSYFQTGVSIGVQENDKKRFDILYNTGAKIFCIDVAHGHHTNVCDMLRWIKNKKLNDIFIIAGNIVTANAVDDLTIWGADAVKVGIGPGFACTTRQDTGVGIPQLFALQQVYERVCTQKLPVKIISDGGCKNDGDIAKALKYSDMVMLGYMLAGTDETPGEIVEGMKVYYGSASFEQKKECKHIEGRKIAVKAKGPVINILNRIKDHLQSSFSYVGATNLTEFQRNCEFIEITEGGKTESKI